MPKKEKKDGRDYFDMFTDMVDYSRQAAESLHCTLTDYRPGELKATMESLHEIEHAGDNEKHLLMEKLTREFIPPIEREDIMALAQVIDDVTDSIEDVLLKIYMYNIQVIREDAVAFTQTILDCCTALTEAMREFRHYKRSEKIHGLIVEINRLEEVGDALYTEAVRRLFTETDPNPAELFAWSTVFSRMERCCDACEHTANVVESVIMKNS